MQNRVMANENLPGHLRPPAAHQLRPLGESGQSRQTNASLSAASAFDRIKISDHINVTVLMESVE
jgi:hypothetical protein